MATSRINIGGKFQNTDIPSQDDFKEIFDSFVHKDEDKANFQMVETGTDDQHYVTPALLRTGLQNIGIITGNSYMPFKEHFDNFIGNTLPLQYSPVKFSAKAFKNGQLLLEKDVEGNEGDYIINYDTAVITFSSDVDNRNIEVDYWYKNLSPNPGGGSNPQIDFTSFLHTSGNETKNGVLTFNNTTPTSTSGIVLTNSGVGSASTSLDVTNSDTGSGISLQNSSTGTGVKVSNAGAGVAINVNSATGSTGDILQVAKNNVVQTKIDSAGNVTAPKFVTTGGLNSEFIKGDGSRDPKLYAEDTKVIHTEGNESKDGALNLTHNAAVQDVLTITKNNSANCLKLIQNSSSNATTSTFDTTTANNNRKAISVQKIGQENAFITHEGNVSGTSFTTLNEKTDITDGFLTLGSSASPTAMSGHAKLYAKTEGTTDMYVMGSDGLEKKIGGVVDLSGKENTIAPGTNAQYYRGDKSWQTLDKTAVGLTNVDNTSDLNKPVSTATQAALDLKASLLSPSLTGTPTAPTAAVGTNSSQIATTAFVLANGDQTPDATTTLKGKIKLAGDLGGTADLPTTPTAVHKTGLEQIRGLKLFQNPTVVDAAGISMTYNTTGPDGLSLRTVNSSAANTGVVFENKGSAGSSSFLVELGASNSGAEGIAINTRPSSLPDVYAIRIFQGTNRSNTKFSVRDTGDTTANSFIKIGGTSSEYLMADGSVTATTSQALPYKVYTAYVNTGNFSNNIVMQNTFGSPIVFSGSGGIYNATLAGAFTFNKTIVFATIGVPFVGSGVSHSVRAYHNDSNSIQFIYEENSTAVGGAKINLEIRVYN